MSEGACEVPFEEKLREAIKLTEGDSSFKDNVAWSPRWNAIILLKAYRMAIQKYHDEVKRGREACEVFVRMELNAQREKYEARIASLELALEMLYEETKDYIIMNNLGDPHQNQSMRLSREAISSSKLSNLFQASLNFHAKSPTCGQEQFIDEWEKVEALRKEVGL